MITRPLNGKPLIAWTIDAAHSSKRVNRVIVSTDRTEIMKIAMDFGADVPFQRPMELAKDDTPGVEPILHAVRWLIENEGYHPDLLCCLQPTSPFRTGDDIDQAISLIIQKNADSVISIAPLNHNPNWMQVMDRNGRLTDFISGGTAINNRQEMDTVYELNGAIYLIRTDVLLENHTSLWVGTSESMGWESGWLHPAQIRARYARPRSLSILTFPTYGHGGRWRA